MRSCVFLCAAVLSSGLAPRPAHAQASISFTTQRVFVTSFTPVIGPGGGVGGVEVDPEGVLVRAVTQPALGKARDRARHGAAAELRRASPMRKVSLKRLEKVIAGHIERREALTEDLLLLAGLQRVEYVFVYPDAHDIVIAGPAEGWSIAGGEAVGLSSGHPVLRLDDLLDALQSAAAAADGHGITCSIDPSEEGMARLQQLFRRRNLQLSQAALEQMEQQLGDQVVTVTGIRPTSHFARVMVAADYMMKRLAMDLEPSPVAGLPSYMEMLKRGTPASQVSTPRWWMAPRYDSVQKTDDDLAWRFRGGGIQALSEHGYLNARGELVNAGRPSPLAKAWADRFTGHYDALCAEIPALGQLRGCVDLAVLAALLMRHELMLHAECPLLLLSDSRKISGEVMEVPRRVASRARAVRGNRGWVVSVSGGVDLDTASVLDQAHVDAQLGAIRERARNQAAAWWWD